MKKSVRFTISMALILSMFVASLAAAQAAAIEPRYTGIYDLSASLSISEQGQASCYGQATVKSGYTADITVELKRDGTTIKTWTNSGSGIVSAGGTYYVTSGHTYVVTTSATIYDQNNHVVESPSKTTGEKTY